MNFYDRDRVKKYGDDLVKCKICGKMYARIGSHAVQYHKYERAVDYYTEFGLTHKEGTSKTYRAIMSEHVVNNGTINNLPKGAGKRFTKGDERIITKSWWQNRKAKQL